MISQPTEPTGEKPSYVGIEPCVDWNLGPGRVDFFPRGEPQEWIPVMLRLKGISPRDFAIGSTMFPDDLRDSFLPLWQKSVRVSPLYTELLPGIKPEFEKLEYITAHVKEAFFEILRNESANLLGKFVDRVTVSPPLPPHSYRNGESTELPPEQVVDPSDPPSSPVGASIVASAFAKVRHIFGVAKQRFVKPRTQSATIRTLGDPLVIVGVIDDGMAFAHERFREPGGGSRVEFFWMQDGLGLGPGPFGFGGLELRKPDLGAVRGIDGLLSDCTFGGLVDEDELYRRAGVIDFPISAHKAITWRRAHGTHVLDLACGFDPQSPYSSQAPPNWRIIGVQLPIASTGLPVSSALATNIIEGIFYILQRSLDVAARLNCPLLPVVINISYGITAGPHDGTHIVESAIDVIVPLWQTLFDVRVVIASGNSHLDRLHAEVTFQRPGEVIDLPWRVLPDDQTPSVLEIWLPHGPPPLQSRVELSVIPPGGGGGGTAPLGEFSGAFRQWPAPTNVLCDVRYAYYLAPTGRGMFRITLLPTARVDSPAPVAPSGLWTIRLQNILLTNADVIHAWIERDEAPYGYPVRGRQSYFNDSAHTRYDDAGRPIEVDNPASIVKHDGAMNAIATGGEPVVMGGMLRRVRRPAKYSAGGPVTPRRGLPPNQIGPDALTVSDDSEAHAGVLAAGTHSGSVVAMNGTSVAAPTITRWVAEQLALGASSDRPAVQAVAVPLPPTYQTPERCGAGGVVLPPVYPLPRRDP